MRKLAKKLLQVCLRHDALWHAVNPLEVKGFRTARKKALSRRFATQLEGHPVVQSGPFQGLTYPTLNSAGSVLVPKLLGTYESELHPVITELRQYQFATIVDVGCAEGYYAIGLARLFPGARVLAYDISERARSLCAEMARRNDVANVEIRAGCDRKDLLALPDAGRNLIVSDCEGFERVLFDRETVAYLRRSHFVIELHDFGLSGSSRAIVPFFQDTHEVRLITSVDDRDKAVRYHAPFVTTEDRLEREAAFAEDRGRTMEWLVATPRDGEAR